LAIWLASWALSVESKKPVTDDRDGLQVTLVAGTRNCLDLLLSTTLNASEEL